MHANNYVFDIGLFTGICTTSKLKSEKVALWDCRRKERQERRPLICVKMRTIHVRYAPDSGC